jgi:hypothetical protein
VGSRTQRPYGEHVTDAGVDPTAMTVDAFVADAATTSDGKIYALGVGWNAIYTSSFPAVHPHLAIVLTIHVPWTQTNEIHSVRVHLETEDGGLVVLGRTQDTPDGEAVDVTAIGGEFSVGRPPALPAGDEQIVPVSLDVNGLSVERPGMYTWVVTIDDRPMRRLPMRVSQVGPGGTPL